MSAVIFIFTLLLLLVILAARLIKNRAQARSPQSARSAHQSRHPLNLNSKTLKSTTTRPLPPPAYLASDQTFVSEAKLNHALKQDPTQYSLYLDLLDLHLAEHNDIATQRLLKHIQTLQQPQLLEQAMAKQQTQIEPLKTQLPLYTDLTASTAPTFSSASDLSTTDRADVLMPTTSRDLASTTTTLHPDDLHPDRFAAPPLQQLSEEKYDLPPIEFSVPTQHDADSAMHLSMLQRQPQPQSQSQPPLQLQPQSQPQPQSHSQSQPQPQSQPLPQPQHQHQLQPESQPKSQIQTNMPPTSSEPQSSTVQIASEQHPTHAVQTSAEQHPKPVQTLSKQHPNLSQASPIQHMQPQHWSSSDDLDFELSHLDLSNWQPPQQPRMADDAVGIPLTKETNREMQSTQYAAVQLKLDLATRYLNQADLESAHALLAAEFDTQNTAQAQRLAELRATLAAKLRV